MKKIFPFLFSFLLAACQGVAVTVTEAVVATPLIESTSTPTAGLIQFTTTPAVTFTPEPTVTPDNVKISPADGMTQLLIPAGTFKMGGLDVLLEGDELPAHDVTLDAFWMDQVEVTNGMYALCAQAGACRLPVKFNSDNQLEYYNNPQFRDYPVVQITWYDANSYCQWTGRRLPTEAEWERAARGDDLRPYPWGGEPPNELNSNSNNIAGDTTRVGSYAAGASPFGVLDMAGNVWEWVADYYSGRYYEESPSVNPLGPENSGLNHLRVIRGGSFQDNQFDLRVSNRGYETGPDPTVASSEAAYYGRSSVKIGFRCAQTP
ncbi:MAG: SUMF1/EgtB/PvdO family nonheme iron enzyme [Chloroflexi bacterium]|nr:SUMF1/EgtB/PvdO family nonheme iron enzyme [Chloroflexota bacterium]